MNPEWWNSLIGGALIGVAVSAMLLLNGRVTGISGILNGLLTPKSGDTSWRVAFLLGLAAGGAILKVLNPEIFVINYEAPTRNLILAGLFVGFGTVMGSGCTSGHGVCGISRLSTRSIIATLTFITAGVASVYAFRMLGWLTWLE